MCLLLRFCSFMDSRGGREEAHDTGNTGEVVCGSAWISPEPFHL